MNKKYQKHKIKQISIMLGCLIITSLLGACASAQDITTPSSSEAEPAVLKVMTHDSFAISEQVLAVFEESNNAKVQFIKSGDTGTALNKAILTIENPLADVFYGVDNTFLSRALDELEVMRQKEGNYIAGDLANRLDYIEDCLGEIKNDSKDLLSHYQERLKERIAVLTRETVEIDPARLSQEAAFLADRSDISEEIVRAESHVRQFRHIMQSQEPGGRKLNFLFFDQ